MTNSINTNVGALKAQQNMVKLNNDLDQAMTRLSSGLRINSAADDAAGSAIASKMESQVRSLGVAIRNSYDAISMTQTAEGALGEVENMLQRVRELAVQAGNSTLSDSDRTMIQSEVTALTNEIDKVAANTHFNGVNLLDGSKDSVNFQIGINANDAINVELQKSDSRSLGLSGSVGVQTLSSERITEKNFGLGSNIIQAADIKINGQNALAADFSSDLTGSTTNEAKSVADAINANTGQHGANADAFNSLTSDPKGTFSMSATFTINGDTVALATSYSDLVTNINQSVSGINATLNADNTMTLNNTTGESIVIVGSSSADVGFTAGTYTGFVSLTNIDGTSVKIEAGNEKNGYDNGQGTIGDLSALGFNELSDGKTVETATVSGTALSANELKLNDVLIGSSSNGQAHSLASAINAKTADHGVTASAKNEVTIALNEAAIPNVNSEFFVNNSNVNLSNVNNVNGIVLAVNNAAIGDVRASSDSNGNLVLSSESGANIEVDHAGDTDFIRAYKDVNGTVSQSGVKGGSTTSATSLRAAAAITATGAQTILTPADFNSQVTITSAGTTSAGGLLAAVDFSAGDQTLLAPGTAVFAAGIQAEFVFAIATQAAVTFTVTGLDLNGNAQTEDVAGKAHTETAYTAKSYSQITNISADIDSNSTGTVAIGYITGEADNNFTIVGKDVFGNTITEVMSGAGGTLAARSKNVFEEVTSISASKTATESISIGNISDASTTAADTAFVAAAHNPDLAAVGAGVDIVASAAIATSETMTVIENSNINGRVVITATATTTVTATLTGLDSQGNTISETIAAFAAGSSVLSTNTYASITSFVHAATDADASFSIGTTDVLLADTTQDLGGAFITISETDSTAANASDAEFVITGTDLAGNVRSETISGPGADGTVTSTIAYATVTQINQTAFGTSDALTFGTVKSGDSFTTRGNLELSNATGEAIKIEAVASDNQLLMEVEDDGGFGTSETVLQKLGVQNQSQSFEVTGTKLAVDSLSNATASLSVIDKAIEQISSFRSSFGAVENRIDASISNLTTLKVNTEAAVSRITDADFAAETSNLTKSQILSQAATSMLAQANASKQNLLALLQG
jgi:flagellin